MSGFRSWADKAFRRAMEANVENIVALFEPGSADSGAARPRL